MDVSMEGNVAIITGGARGFGKAFGIALGELGAHIVLVDLDGAEAERAALELTSLGSRAVGLQGDVSDEAAMTRVMETAAAFGGGIDILINNAGLHSEEYGQRITTLGTGKVRRLFEVNVIGTVCCTLAALPFMKGRAGANVINIASAAAHLGGSAYGDSKLAVAGLTITFARELAREAIRVNAISPGLIMTDTIRAELTEESKARAKSLQWLDADGGVQDVVRAMLYLASPDARFITGEVMRVGGGMGAGI